MATAIAKSPSPTDYLVTPDMEEPLDPASVELMVPMLESIGFEFEKKNIDHKAGIVRDVQILGSSSTHGYDYSQAAMEDAVNRGVYESCPVYSGHPPRRNPYAERDVEDLLGEIKGVRVAVGSVRGDFHYFRDHPVNKSVLEAAERGITRLSFSHNADTFLRKVDGKARPQVTKIDRARSIDVVTKGATAKTLFESEGDEPVGAMEGMNYELCDAAVSAVRVILGRGDIDDVAKRRKVNSVVKQFLEFGGKVHAVTHESEEPPEKAVETKTVLESEEIMATETKAATGDDIASLRKELGEMKTMLESEQQKRAEAEAKVAEAEAKAKARSEAIAALEGAGIESPTDLQVRIFSALESDEDREAYVDGLKKTKPVQGAGGNSGGTTSKPKSTPAHTALESEGDGGKPVDLDEIASRLIV